MYYHIILPFKVDKVVYCFCSLIKLAATPVTKQLGFFSHITCPALPSICHHICTTCGHVLSPSGAVFGQVDSPGHQAGRADRGQVGGTAHHKVAQDRAGTSHINTCFPLYGKIECQLHSF